MLRLVVSLLYLISCYVVWLTGFGWLREFGLVVVDCGVIDCCCVVALGGLFCRVVL